MCRKAHADAIVIMRMRGGIMARESAGTRMSTPIPAAKAEAPEPDTLKPESHAAEANKPAPRWNQAIKPVSLVPHRLTTAERHRLISDLAYRKAQVRDFAPGGEVEDWLEAEREVDAGRY
jgi:Tfp pilus assembly protein FimV